jgi:hypothetical protein
MPTFALPSFSGSPDQVADELAKLRKELNFSLNHLDHENIQRVYTEYCDVRSECGETIIDGPTLKMYDTPAVAGTTSTGVLRLKMGYSTASDDFAFSLYNAAGALTVSIDSSGDAMMRGTVRTGTTDEDRLEMSGAGFRGLTNDGLLSGLVFAPTTLDYWDAYLYHLGVPLLKFQDDINGFTICGTTAASYMGLGSLLSITNAYGAWRFFGSVDFSTANDCTGLITGYGGYESIVTSPSTVDGHTHTIEVGDHRHSVGIGMTT